MRRENERRRPGHDPNLDVVVVPAAAALVADATAGEAGALVPWAPKRACAVPKCPHYATERGRCAEHAKPVRDEGRRFAVGSLAYGRRWRKARLRYLSEHPFCAWPGCDMVATDLDHIVPHRGNEALYWSEENWQGLCERHHGEKTARETRA